MKYEAGSWTVEWSKPLNSGDEQDMSVSPGDTMGIFCKIIDDFNGSISKLGSGIEPSKASVRAVFGPWPPGANGNDATTYGDLVLAKPTYGNIEGVVTECNGVTPIESATVNVSANGIVATTTTNETGYYLVPNLNPGDYTVTISKKVEGAYEEWYALNTTIVHVDAGVTTTHNVNLRHVADFDCNCRVDITDLMVFASEWGTCGDGIPSDFDESGCVEITDLMIFAGQWQAVYCVM